MQSYLHLTYDHESTLPDRFADDDVRTPEAFVEHFLRAFTDPGDVVLDPFCGFGTTLRVAERLGREAYGIEYDPERAAFVRERVDRPERVVRGDALDAASYGDLPPVDCCLTSPPYTIEVAEHDPLTNYTEPGGEYADYLADLGRAFGHVDDVLRDGGHVLVDVANLRFEGAVTTLAWDVAEVVAERFWFEGEVVVTWEQPSDSSDGAYGNGYDHSYCLVFESEP
ncbi:DNA methyltransferase [Halomarina rubra]|uniref:Type II methyltransferase n=1 Tax=Halomarina rubra TaxID=2071873 RepID=A0ABD6AXX7_9EURY|nr:DNA methyltransferase [Halomarina rubra]